jgi:hypothetical protein
MGGEPSLGSKRLGPARKSHFFAVPAMTALATSSHSFTPPPSSLDAYGVLARWIRSATRGAASAALSERSVTCWPTTGARSLG